MGPDHETMDVFNDSRLKDLSKLDDLALDTVMRELAGRVVSLGPNFRLVLCSQVNWKPQPGDGVAIRCKKRKELRKCLEHIKFIIRGCDKQYWRSRKESFTRGDKEHFAAGLMKVAQFLAHDVLNENAEYDSGHVELLYG